MKVGQDFSTPESTFLALEKDMGRIAEKLLTNQRLMKMLYYTRPDCLKAKDLTPQERASLINKQIKIVPAIEIQQECPIYVLIIFNNWRTNIKNPKFRDCNMSFCILCHPDHWNMGNFQLRPYKIAGEIDAMINNQKLTGIGEAQFLTANNLVIDNQLMGLAVTYRCINDGSDSTPVE